MRYSAFISYRHGGLDGMVAAKLHKLLEAYTLPSALAQRLGMKKLKKVFRDREELPISADLGASIKSALSESEFLIVICSKRLRESVWCMQEVDTFIRMHGRQNVLTVLIDGEPHESFPPQVLTEIINGVRVDTEPLAADVRAASAKNSLRLLKHEALRLIAPMVNCTYDDLRQREKGRRRRRVIATVAASLAVLSVFGAITTALLLRVNDTQQKKLIIQSHTLAEYATAAHMEGDPVTALLLSLEALPESTGKPGRPYVPAAEYTLASVLDAYNYQDPLLLRGVSKEVYAMIREMHFSPDGSMIALSGLENVDIYSTQNMEKLASFPCVKIDSFMAGDFLTPDVFVYPSAEGPLTAVNIRSGEALWTSDRPYEGVLLSGDRQLIYAMESMKTAIVHVYDAQGAFLRELKLSQFVATPQDTATSSFVVGRYWINEEETCALVAYSNGVFTIVDLEIDDEYELYGYGVDRVTWENDILAFDVSFSGDDDLPAEHVGKTGVSYLANTRTFSWIAQIGTTYPSFSTVLADGTCLYSDGGDIFSYTYQGEAFRFEDARQITSLPNGDLPSCIYEENGELIVLADSGRMYFVNMDTGETIPYRTNVRYGEFITSGKRIALMGGTREHVLLFDRQDNPVLQRYDVNDAVQEVYSDLEKDRLVVLGEKYLSSYSIETGALLARKEYGWSIYTNSYQYGNLLIVYDYLPMSNKNVYSNVCVYDISTLTLLDMWEENIDVFDGFFTFGSRALAINGDDYPSSEWIDLPEGASRMCRVRNRLFYVVNDTLYQASPRGVDREIGAYNLMGYDESSAFLALASGDRVHLYSIAKNKIISSIDTKAYQAQFVPGHPILLLTSKDATLAYDIDTGTPISQLTGATGTGNRLHAIPGEDSRAFLQYYDYDNASAMDSRYRGIFIDLQSMERLASIDGMHDVMADNTAFISVGETLVRTPVYTTDELIQMGQERVGGIALTKEQARQFNLADD